MKLKIPLRVIVAMVLASFGLARGADAPPAVAPAAASATKPAMPVPTLADVPYGKHRKQMLHFWKAPGASAQNPAPVAFYIHGGGWQNGDRTRGQEAFVTEMLKNGLSVVSVEYRFISEATADGEKPPVRGPLYDAARALQLVRSKAAEWHTDKQRIGLCGGSAGACTSLWLTFHNDLADPTSSDPIARESTRPYCAAVTVPQTTLDPQQMKEWTPNSRYGGHAFGFKSFGAFLAEREKILPWIAEYSPYALVTAEDPPVYMFFRTPPALGKEEKDPTHTANFGVKLQEKCKSLGVACEVVYPGAPDVKHATVQDYLIAKLKEGKSK